ncbi:hypothetical protein CJD36_016900 [Flavipsychrobacter stenotrophus]|uniref:Uncharacterized protein n=1 Tax=Flavipsychrobacter stenotrophus TaxID=2077091 RepID=A0A2S7SSN2_9BACT|nr:hypothetical protein [Flavipsychrobacter stenotrophus]PQJ09617.1 hypothetical protein CJD36_016900 [Flavipsychrobacter stenotrophus]
MNRYILLATGLMITVFSICSCSKKNDAPTSLTGDTIYSSEYLNLQLGSVYYSLKDYKTSKHPGISMYCQDHALFTPATFQISESDGEKVSGVDMVSIRFFEMPSTVYRVDSTSNLCIITGSLGYAHPTGIVNLTHNDSSYIEGSIDGIITKQSHFDSVITFRATFKLYKY